MNVVALNERRATSWKAATLVTVQERKTKGRGDRAGPRADFYRAAVDVMAHDHPARIARLGCDVSAETRAPPSMTDWPGASASASTSVSTWTMT
jgi:hypothetical protein